MYRPLLILFLVCVSCSKSLQAQQALNQQELLDSIHILDEILQHAEDVNDDIEAANRYINLVEQLSKLYASCQQVPELLFRAGDVSVGLATYDRSLQLWEQLIIQYPAHALNPRALFFQGFVLDTKMGQDALAKTKYESFINKYPRHELNANASLLLSQLGQSDMDLLKQFKTDNKQR
ncbi:MAG: hypothetical protein P8P48_07940 [Saprospiraceae bacterium]|nr:hypothetical protein [Saprospiraceae bacterium]